MHTNRAITIRSQTKRYSVQFLDKSATIDVCLRHVPASTFIVLDDNVGRIHAEFLHPLLQTFPVLRLASTERNKSLRGAQQVLSFLQAHRATTKSLLVVIGGGITQDIASFAAHVYFRGISWMFLPTTLLAMCDSCIGGKSAVNFHTYKNQLGVFHPPDSVQIFPQFLTTLPRDYLLSGWGEMLKLHLLGSQRLWRNFLRVGADAKKTPPLSLIRDSLLIKRSFIQDDEFDRGRRRLLNYGHTFGHAIESVTHFSVPHGCAIAWGMDIVNYLSVQSGILSQKTFSTIHHLIEENIPPLPRIATERLLSAAAHDKKNSPGTLLIARLRSPGNAQLAPVSIDLELRGTLHRYFNTYCSFRLKENH